MITTRYARTTSDLLEQLVTSLLASSTLFQDDNNFLLSILGNKQCKPILLQTSRFLSMHVKESLDSVELFY